MYIDTHCHLGKEDFADVEEVITKSHQAGVDRLIASGCSRSGIEEVLDLQRRYPSLFVTIGYHPDVASEVTEEDMTYLEQALLSHSVVGIGEIGLDYHYGKENEQEQKALFRAQLELAQNYHLPVVIHTRDAIQDTYDILKEYSVCGVLHCFNESYEMARLFLNLGFYFGIGGVLTFKNSKLYQVVKELPFDRLLLETDSPYLAPDPFRGKQNGPWNIPVIAQKLAEVKEVDVSIVAKTTTENAECLFDLAKKL